MRSSVLTLVSVTAAVSNGRDIPDHQRAPSSKAAARKRKRERDREAYRRLRQAAAQAPDAAATTGTVTALQPAAPEAACSQAEHTVRPSRGGTNANRRAREVHMESLARLDTIVGSDERSRLLQTQTIKTAARRLAKIGKDASHTARVQRRQKKANARRSERAERHAQQHKPRVPGSKSSRKRKKLGAQRTTDKWRRRGLVRRHAVTAEATWGKAWHAQHGALKAALMAIELRALLSHVSFIALCFIFG